MGDLSNEKVPSVFKKNRADGVAGKRRVQVSQPAVSSWFSFAHNELANQLPKVMLECCIEDLVIIVNFAGTKNARKSIFC